MKRVKLSKDSKMLLMEAIEEVRRKELIEWRRQPAVVRVEKPTNIEAARRLGYKAKPGFIIVRSRVRKGGRRKPRPRSGRRPKHMGVVLFKPGKSRQKMAEERAAKKYPNMRVLGSYWVGEDGVYKWFEVVMVDPNHPAVLKDPRFRWLKDD
ncbi:MAG: 50S ribosomal protein L15e [Candidatus Brockarchaeota archaeon]|nr:50S ribosomal protein L15e [Candidatus Brockarchaeota archaeon]